MKREYCITGIFSIFLSLAIFLTIKIPTDFLTVMYTGMDASDIGLFGLIWILTAAALYGVQRLLYKVPFPKETGRIPALAVYALIFAAWLPMLLSCYPGNLSGDSYSSINQAMTQIRSTAHPVLFTLLVRLCLKTGLFLFGDMNAAIAVFSVVQMLLLDGILTYSVMWMQKHRAPVWWLAISTIYFALNPLIMRYAFTMWKDILFSGVMLLIVLFLYDLVTGEISFTENKTLARFLVLSVLAAFLRNRIVYGVIGIYILLLFMYRAEWKRLLPAFAVTAAITLLIQGPLYRQMNIKPSNFAEGQGVTLQQLAAVVVNGGRMTEEEKAFLNRMIPLEDIPAAYRPGSVDSLKGCKTFDHDFLNAHSSEYMRVWWGVFLKNPWICIRAWLMNTRGFWGFNVWIEPFAITWPSERWQIYQTNITKELLGLDLNRISNGVLVNMGKVPVLRRLFDLGCLGWFGAFIAMQMIIRKRYPVLLALLPMIALWLTLIASTPVFHEVRYMFVYHLALPVLGYILLRERGTDTQ